MQYIKAFTKLYPRADTTAQHQKKCNLERRLRNIYSKIDAKPHLQNLVDLLKSELKQIKIKEAQGAKIRAKITWESEVEKCTKYFFQKLDRRKDANQAIMLKDQQEILK